MIHCTGRDCSFEIGSEDLGYSPWNFQKLCARQGCELLNALVPEEWTWPGSMEESQVMPRDGPISEARVFVDILS
jgi:hypothetical protein